MNSVYSVGHVNFYIKKMFEQDGMLNKISVKGEISNCKYHRSGHIYFTLKDETGSISCVMFAGYRRGLTFQMKDGDKVTVTGTVDVYVRDGGYQLYAKEIVLEGLGFFYARFWELKKELEEMGMFASEYKKLLPFYVKKLGVVTAPTGAAVRDIQNIAYQKNPYIQLILYPALVQGEGAKESIAEGIKMLDLLGLDAIIIGRGGGSIEDLWAFNEEVVARAIFNCRTPVISAVGHETDTTIADFVADFRAPTPSAAAELAVADIRKILSQIAGYSRQLHTAFEKSLDYWKERIAVWKTRWNYLSPRNQIQGKRQKLLDMENRLQEYTSWILTEKRHRMQLLIQRMNGLSPLNKLNQGFSYVEDINGRNVASIHQAKRGDVLLIQVRDGCIYSTVHSVKEQIRAQVVCGED
ncbi:MAG: exodeoxyribonuclease VII large subunit [Lachnospiraceae bacterium]|nr:exodeoxyribonuclease VII large subunit [Lachnospiraceae bacterium]